MCHETRSIVDLFWGRPCIKPNQMTKAYEHCGFLGFGASKFDLASMCDAPGVAFRDGKCVSTVDVTSDNASMCDAPGITLRDGKCVIKYSKPHNLNFGNMTPGNDVSIFNTMDYLISDSGGVPVEVNVKASCHHNKTNKITIKQEAFEDVATKRLSHSVSRLPDEKRGNVEECFRHASIHLRKTHDNSTLLEALDGRGPLRPLIYGEHGIVLNCLRSHGS